MVCGGPENINKDKGFMLASMLCSLDTHWQTYLRQKANIEKSTMEEIFNILEKQMMISKPMSVRRSEFVIFKQNDGENAPSFLIVFKRIGVIRNRIGIGIIKSIIRFGMKETEYFKIVFLFLLTE